jgi:hypothetical protein
MSIVSVRPDGVAAWGGVWYNSGSYGPSPSPGQVADSNDGTYIYGVDYNTYAEFNTGNYALAANERCWRARAVARLAGNSTGFAYDVDVWLKPVTAGDGGNFHDTGPRGGPTNVVGPWYDGEWDQNTLNQFRIAIRENNTGVTVANWFDVWIDYEILHAPTATGVTPSGTVTTRTPTLAWTYSDPDGRGMPQTNYEINGYISGGGIVYYESTPNANTSKVLPALGNGTYDFYVRSTNANFGGWTGSWGVTTFTVNAAPAAPANIQRTGVVTDNTPNFSADLTGYAGIQNQTKARFEIWNADAAFAPTTLVGSVDSVYVTGATTVNAEYASALPIGRYVVRAMAIESGGQSSGWSGYTQFQILQAVNVDSTLLWNAAASTVAVTKDVTLLWNTQVNNQIDLTLLWNTYVEAHKDVTLLWNTALTWVEVDDDAGTTWTGVEEG